MKWRILYEFRLAWQSIRKMFPSKFYRRASRGELIEKKLNAMLDRGHFLEAFTAFETEIKYKSFKPSQVLAFNLLAGVGRRAEAFATYRNTQLSKDIKNFLKKKSVRDFAAIKLAKSTDKVLVLAWGGPGDEIRYANYYPVLASLTPPNLTFTCDPRLLLVMQQKFPHLDFLPVNRLHRLWASGNRERLGNASKLPSLSLYRALDDNLFHALGDFDTVVFLADILGDLEVARIETSRQADDPATRNGKQRSSKRVGIAWRSIVQNKVRNLDYFSVSELAPLLEISDAQFVCLQAGLTAQEKIELEALFADRLLALPTIDLVDDLHGLKQIIDSLDCVLGPTTYLAEFAGFLGAPTILISNSAKTLFRHASDGIDFLMPSMMHCTPDLHSATGRPDIEKAARMAKQLLGS